MTVRPLRALFLAASSLALVGCFSFRRDVGIADACSSPSSTSCPAECDRCDGGVCHIDCSAGGCEQRILECAPGMDCALHCDGAGSCREANVIGPVGGSLSMACSGDASCDDVVVAAESGLELSCAGAQACQSAHLLCGNGTCDWTCKDSDSCSGLVVR